jgi:hypothetical protein
LWLLLLTKPRLRSGAGRPHSLRQLVVLPSSHYVPTVRICSLTIISCSDMLRHALVIAAVVVAAADRAKRSRSALFPKATRRLHFSHMLKSFKYVLRPLLHVQICSCYYCVVTTTDRDF